MRGEIHIKADTTKTSRERRIPISKYLVEELKLWGPGKGYVIDSGRHEGERHRQARARDFERAWERAKVDKRNWEGQPTHAFRKGFKTGLLVLGALPDAVDYLQGHAIGGSRGRYIDPRALRLDEMVELIPPISDPVIHLSDYRNVG